MHTDIHAFIKLAGLPPRITVITMFTVYYAFLLLSFRKRVVRQQKEVPNICLDIPVLVR